MLRLRAIFDLKDEIAIVTNFEVTISANFHQPLRPNEN